MGRTGRDYAMKLRARWVGDLPRAGDYLMSTSRPKFAYRVLEVKTHGSMCRQLTIEVDRLLAGDVPMHARIHPWRWDARG